jgi:hypothetical protein
MERLTDEQLAEIRKRAEAATDGPWTVSFPGAKVINAYGIGVDNFDEDAEFIAHAREDVPKLLAEIGRLKEALVDIADTGESYHEHYCRDIAREALRNA